MFPETYEDYHVSFLHHMVDEHGWDTDDVIYFVDAPHKWRRELKEFKDTGEVEV
jgi:hypothetical protein